MPLITAAGQLLVIIRQMPRLSPRAGAQPKLAPGPQSRHLIFCHLLITDADCASIKHGSSQV